MEILNNSTTHWYLPEMAIEKAAACFRRLSLHWEYYTVYAARIPVIFDIDVGGSISIDSINDAALEWTGGIPFAGWDSGLLPTDQYIDQFGGLNHVFWALDSEEPTGATKLQAMVTARMVTIMFVINVYTCLNGCFHYRPRPGSGNFTNHPERRYIYPGNVDY